MFFICSQQNNCSDIKTNYTTPQLGLPPSAVIVFKYTDEKLLPVPNYSLTPILSNTFEKSPPPIRPKKGTGAAEGNICRVYFLISLIWFQMWDLVGIAQG